MSTADLDRLLAPLGLEGFVADVHEQRPHLFSGARDRLATLPDIDDIDALVAYGELRSGRDVSLVDHARGGRLPTDSWCYPSGLVDAAGVAAQFRAGASIVLPQLQWRFPALAHLVRDVEQAFGARSQTNLYLTPPAAQGLAPHHDTHGVLALQLAGTKHWRLYEPQVELPLPDMPSDPERVGDPVTELTTGPGDVLYLPRGQVHDARTDEGAPSLHATLGINPMTWVDVLASALAAAAHEDVALRAALPAGWLEDDPDTPALPDLERWVPVALERLRDDLVVTRHALAPGALNGALAPLTGDVVVEVRPTTMVRRRRLEDGRLEVVAAGSRLTFTAEEAPVAELLLDGQARPLHAAGEGAVELADGMLRHGLLRRVPAGGTDG